MEKKTKLSFEEIMKQNERRMHLQIYKLNIDDPHEEFYQGGIVVFWNAYETYQPDMGTLSTYFNYIIRRRLINLLRRKEYEDA